MKTVAVLISFCFVSLFTITSHALTIDVVNQSAAISNGDVQVMIDAVTHQVHNEFADSWVQSANGTYLTDVTIVATTLSNVASDAYVIYLSDDDGGGDWGYHTMYDYDTSTYVNPYGIIFVNNIVTWGAATLYDPAQETVSSVFDHEVLETLMDPMLATWDSVSMVTNFYGDQFPATSILQEVCDPVEFSIYVTTIDSQGVTLSDFVNASWYNASASGPYDQTDQISAPLTLGDGGEVLIMQPGGPYNYTYAYDSVPKRAKNSKLEAMEAPEKTDRSKHQHKKRHN